MTKANQMTSFNYHHLFKGCYAMIHYQMELNMCEDLNYLLLLTGMFHPAMAFSNAIYSKYIGVVAIKQKDSKHKLRMYQNFTTNSYVACYLLFRLPTLSFQ